MAVEARSARFVSRISHLTVLQEIPPQSATNATLPVMRQLEKTDNDIKTSRLEKAFYYITLIIAVFGIPLFVFGIINTMVSLKYETENPTDCISSVTGQDLCLTINVFKRLILICVVILILLFVFRKRLLGKNL